MATFILLANLTDDGLKAIKNDPELIINEINEELRMLGVEAVSQYSTLGPYDFVSIVEAADHQIMTRGSVELALRGNMKVLTMAALPIDEFINSLR
jgi:uncharacterized protein with GYD domain